MKILFMKMFVVLFVLVGVASVSVRAQALAEGTIEADVPFAFVVNNITLPAGKYTFVRVEQTQPQTLEIRGTNGRRVVMFYAQNAQLPKIPRDTQLVFNKVGDQYFLSQIWANDTNLGYELPKTKAEEGLEGSGIQSERRSILARMFKWTKDAK